MDSISDGEVTQLIEELRQDPDQFDRLIPLMYNDLRRIGHNQRAAAGFIAGPTLQTTALVNEAFLKLRGRLDQGCENRLHFQRLMAKVMRQLIIDYARRQLAEKRGGMNVHETLTEAHAAADDVARQDSDFTLAVEEALKSLEADNPRQAEILAATLYAGYTSRELADILDLSERTVRRELQKGRAWLMLALDDARP
ncbi:MAG: ECF-type sigma factor [Wenzhouxiangella sp.]